MAWSSLFHVECVDDVDLAVGGRFGGFAFVVGDGVLVFGWIVGGWW